MDKKQQISITLCIVIFLMAVAGSIMCFGEIYVVQTKALEHGILFLKFFTVQSNVLGGISALLYVIFLLRANKKQTKIPTWVHVLRYIATIDLTITFLVVALFLGFITDEGYFSMYANANFFFHLAVPVLSFVSFCFFEKAPKFKFSFTFLGIIHLALYSIFYLIVVLTHYDYQTGKIDLYYDWYGFAQLGLPIAFVAAVVVIGLGFLVAFLLYKINNKQSKKVQQKEPEV